MNLYGRLSLRFLLQIGALLLMIWCVVGVVAVWYAAGKQVAAPSAGPDPLAVLRQMPAATTIRGGGITVAAGILADVQQSGGWLQVLDDNGGVVFSFHAPANVPTRYAPGLLVYDRLNPDAFGYRLATWYGAVDDRSLTWLYGLPLGRGSGAPARNPYLYVLALLGGSLAVAILAAMLFGQQLGRPLLHMMEWLQNLARGCYAEPTDRHGVPRSRTASGELRRPYRVYREVLSALERLVQALRQADRDRDRLERTREEWISGITHDLRTPLASVRGYADLFAAPSYTWSEDEVRRLGRIIAEKAAHMDGLIEDLGLTFRLRNHALPLQPAPVDVVELVRAVVIDLVNAPASDGQSVTFESAEASILYPLDAQWFTRALDNLASNASLHNPQGTTIAVSVQALREGGGGRYPGVRIRIQDDGAGMDQETLEHLFDRYYRGTNTSDARAKGSGLGAAIARQLVEAHGGRVSVESAVGRGTSMVLELPPRN